MNELLSDKCVCETSPATLGLLISILCHVQNSTICDKFFLNFPSMFYLLTMSENSWKLIMPSWSLSMSRMVLSTICCSCPSFRLDPTIICSTWRQEDSRQIGVQLFELVKWSLCKKSHFCNYFPNQVKTPMMLSK